MSERKGIHHGYIGMMFVFVAFIGSVLNWSPFITYPLFAVGFYLWTEDFIQHLIQLDYPKYRSPLNRLYTSIHWPEWVLTLNAWFDKLFGKG